MAMIVCYSNLLTLLLYMSFDSYATFLLLFFNRAAIKV